MGSLPNLHELCRDSDSEDSPEFRHTAPITNQHQIIIHDERLRNFTQFANATTTSAIVRNHIQHPHRILCRTRSNGHHNHIFDGSLLMEQVATCSPMISRSTRTLSQHQNQVNSSLLIGRRRESLSSSIGATSVRRLIGVVRNPNSRLGPVYSRQILIKNLLTLCIAHALISASFLPLLALQSSISAWHWPLKHSFITNLDLGSILMTILYIFASLSSLVSPLIVQKCGTSMIFILGYVMYTIFFGCHLFPIVYVLFPAYVLLGLMLGPISLSRVTFVMTLSSKMSYIATDDEELEEHKHIDTRRTCLIRRLARALQGAQDIGLIFGSILTAVLISFTFSNDMLSNLTNSTDISFTNSTTILRQQFLGSSTTTLPLLTTNVTQYNNVTSCIDTKTCDNSSIIFPTAVTSSSVSIDLDNTPVVYYYASYDDLFDMDDNGNRICGSNACPITLYFNFNISDQGLMDNFIYILPIRTSTILTTIYLSCALIASVLACIGLDKIQLLIQQDPMERSIGLSALRAMKETFKDTKLQLSAPLAVFIGLEQGFMYADFSKSYVMCSLGVYNINLVFLSMGLLQSLAAFTLSMLLRTIKRYIVIAVGVAFQSLLIMVLILWKPSGDDPALFYVISAAWGVCNAIWEMLNFTFLTKAYAENWEPAFANSIFYRFMGLAFAFGVHGLLCNWLKLYLLALFLLMSIVPYIVLEIRLENTRKLKSISRL